MISPHELQRLLEAELLTLEALNAALGTERAALTANDVEALETATAAKRQATENHRRQQQQRLDAVERAGLESQVQLAALVDKLAVDERERAALQSLQQRLAELATRCQGTNRQNGTLILRMQERTRGALDVLRGADSSSDVYSLSGAREGASDTRTLGKA